MDKGTLFGIIAGVGLVISAILMGSGLMTFFNLPSILIVGGGTMAAIAIAFPTDELKLIVMVTKKVFKSPKNESLESIQFLLQCKQAARKSGFLILEEMSKKAPSKAVEKGLKLIADGTNESTIREILSTEQTTMEEHHRVGQKIFSEMGKFAPAFGMIGTLIGLVQMLSKLDDPSTIGPKMAVALLTTFYGALMANLFFIPMVTKLERRIKIETKQIQLAIVGLMSVNRDESIQIMREKLKAFIAEQEGDLDAVLNKGK